MNDLAKTLGDPLPIRPALRQRLMNRGAHGFRGLCRRCARWRFVFDRWRCQPNGVSEQEGTYWWWDSIDNQKGKWYDSAATARFTNAAPDGAGGGLRTAVIQTVDAPGGGPPVLFKGHNLTQMQLVWDFRLFVAAQTVDAHLPADANSVYVAESQAVGQGPTGATASWRFDGTGTIGIAAQYAWTQTGAGVTAPTGWSGVPNITMNLNGKQFNSILKKTAKWA